MYKNSINRPRVALYFTGIIVLIAIFIVIAWLYHQPAWKTIDLQLLKDLQPLRSSSGIWFFTWMSFIGTSKVLIVLIFALCVFLLIRKHYIVTVLLVMDFIGERLLNILLKDWFQRPRPPLHHLVQVSGFSFPSGHAMNALSVYGFIAIILFYVIKAKPLKYFLISICILLIILITFSRPYLNVHYFTDVTASWCMAGAWLLFLTLLAKKFEQHFLSQSEKYSKLNKEL